MGGSNSSSSSSSAVAAALMMAVTAYVTYQYATRLERQRQQTKRLELYQQEKQQQQEEASSSKDPTEPDVKLLEGIRLDKVYMYELEDLRKIFESANVLNKLRSPKYKKESSRLKDMLLFGTTTADNEKPESYYERDYLKIIGDSECILAQVHHNSSDGTNYGTAFLRAGPRQYLHFDPAHVSAAIVTCGGLCPGLNNVIRELTNTLFNMYGIGGNVYGIRGGFQGFNESPIRLTAGLVEDIHHIGGTWLGSSRGGFDLETIVAFLKRYKINQLFIIGGDGTHRGAFRIHQGCMEQNLNIAVAGIPKTIDNDISYLDYSFGFRSAVEAAVSAIRTAKTEAVCNLPNGIGIVKLMGRSAGYIAAHATMASSDVDLCLVPEVPVILEGPTGCLPHLMRRVERQGFAVVVVAEGAGEELLGTSTEKDASGNKKLPAIGEYMQHVIAEYFQKNGKVATVKYIDPSYMVRSVPANAADSVYCMQLAQNAVHGAMAGYTGFSVGLASNRTVLIPIPTLVATSPNAMNPHGRTWERVLALTGQPNPDVPKQKTVSNAPVLK